MCKHDLCYNALCLFVTASPASSPLLSQMSPPSQAGGEQLGGALAPQGGPGAPQHQVMAQCAAPLPFCRGQWQHPAPPSPHQVLYYCLQVRDPTCSSKLCSHTVPHMAIFLTHGCINFSLPPGTWRILTQRRPLVLFLKLSNFWIFVWVR